MIALAIEECNLHKRVALKALRVVGTSPRMLLVGFMLPTAILSMWISNTASSAMMIPILEAVLSEVLSGPDDAESGKGEAKLPQQISSKSMRAMLAMSVCMSANIGGTATTIGQKFKTFRK
jgi:sodium-dependent dicarboxylate transporter 2/3/5